MLTVGSPDREIVEARGGYAFRYYDNGAVGPVQTDLSAMMLEVEDDTVGYALDALHFLLHERVSSTGAKVEVKDAKVVPIRPVVPS